MQKGAANVSDSGIIGTLHREVYWYISDVGWKGLSFLPTQVVALNRGSGAEYVVLP